MNRTLPPSGGDDVELSVIATEQHRELMAAKSIDFDRDFAFGLQLQEAITASLSLQPSSSVLPELSVPLSSNDNAPSLADLQAMEIEKLQQELSDRVVSETESKKQRDDLFRRIHDQRVATDIHQMPVDEWDNYGDYYERPYGEGSSRTVHSEVFKLYFKGLMGEEKARDSSSKLALGGIGVAICDSSDQSVFEMRKPFAGNGMGRQAAEAKALIEGLNAAMDLDLKRLVICCDYYPIYQFVTRRWFPKQRKIANLINQVFVLQTKFTDCNPSLVARNDVKFAFRLAREAIDSQINKPAESSTNRNTHETCTICLEATDNGKMFSVDVCSHSYCFSCMKQHVEVKLLHGIVPKCPHENCNSQLKIGSCLKFLTPKLIEMMRLRLREASIPVTETVYCPYPKCSALMSKSEVLEYSKESFVGIDRSGLRRCIKCQGTFCINCKVPWHLNMTCYAYKKNHPHLPAEEKLKTLAARNLWRQCVKCSHMIELSSGCFHMTCRCGYEFCYTCGAEWKDKKATCSCPLWDEENIVFDSDDEFGQEDFDDEEEEEDDDDEFFYSDNDDYYWL